MDGNSRGSGCRFHLRKGGLNRTSDLQRVRTILAGDDEHGTGSSLNGGSADHGFGTFCNRGDVFQPNAAAVLVPQNNVAELVWQELLSFGSKHHTLIRSIHETGSANTGCSSGGVQHFINRRAELEQPVGTDLDLKLAHLSAEDDNLGHTGHSQQPGPESQSANVRISISDRVSDVRPT